MPHLLVAVILSLLAVTFSACADDVPDTLWTVIQASYFAGKTIQDGDTLIRVQAPEQAEDSSLVPFSFQITLPSGDFLKRAYLFTDVNPIQLTALFHFSGTTNQADISTRIRLDKNTYVRVIAETVDGRLFMQKIPIKTPGGGCGGGSGDDEAKLRQQAGRIKIQVEPSRQDHLPGAISFHIRHPMRTGFERTSMGYYAKAWFINRLDFSMNGHPLLGIDVGPGVSADPYFRFSYTPDGQGMMEVLAGDNEGNKYSEKIKLLPMTSININHNSFTAD